MMTTHQSIQSAHLSRKLENPITKIMLLAFVAIAAIAWHAKTNAAELGRLFYTPQQRAQLETKKTTGALTEGGKQNSIMVNGVIQKQGGNRIVWLNGEAQTPVRSNDNPASIDVAVPGKSKHVPVKVGQRLMLDMPAPSDSNPPTANSVSDNND